MCCYHTAGSVSYTSSDSSIRAKGTFMRSGVLCGFMLALVAFGLQPLHAQGVQTGTLTGRVESTDGLPLPEATVAVTSSALQGERSTTSDVNGVYVFRSLPPGRYNVRITRPNFSSSEQTVDVPLGATATLDAILPLAQLAETVVVEAAPPPVTNPTAGTNIRSDEVNLLPVGRTPLLITELAPGLTNNTPNAGQVTISGGFGYDNVFLIDGVDVGDTLLGTINDVFIEEAIEEVQVLTSGISAEYGRFSGGVVNIITKSGGNSFAGSYRTTFTNPSWTEETPLEKGRGTKRRDKLSTFHEVTLGGPIVRDRLWFFGAGRFENFSTSSSLPQTGIPFTSTRDNKRYEAKLTGAVRPGQTLQGTFVDNRVHRKGEPVLSFSVDPATFISPSTPNHLVVLTYNGALSSRMLATAQFSRKHFATEGVGGTSRNIVDSPFLTASAPLLQYNAPHFDASDPEQRNNRQLTANLSYFLSSPRAGSHDFKGGIEQFTSTRIGANAQSSTSFVFISNFKTDAAGKPAFDANGRLIPRFVPGGSAVQRWLPTRGAQFDMTTTSLYFRDRWVASPHLTMDLGLRYEHAGSEATGTTQGVDTHTIVPRVGASYDLAADGQTVFQATYGRYAGKYNDQQFSRNTNVGNSDRYTTVYFGPPGEGRDFAPGFDVTTYRIVVAGAFPALNIRFDEDLSSSVTQEFTLAAGRTFGARSYGKLIYVQRNVLNFVEDFITIANGTAPIVIDGVTVGQLDNVVYRNSDEPRRKYKALEFLGSHSVRDRLLVSGQWTVQLENDGNFEGEAPNPTSSPLGDYPEIIVAARSAPTGRLDDFQRHKIRIWANYSVPVGRFGTLDVAPLFRYNSALTYSLVATNVPLSAVQRARDPGYAGVPAQLLFFGERGSQRFEGYGLFDLALTYSAPLWRTARPWIKFEALNLFNNQKLIAWDTAIAPDNAGPKDADGLPTEFIRGPRFGTATANSHFPRPRPGADGGRMLQFAVGLRF